MPDRRFITDENFDEAVSFCCQNVPQLAEPDQHKKTADVAVRYLKEDMESHRGELPANCTAREYRHFVDEAIYRADVLIRHEHKDQGCVLRDVPDAVLMASLLSTWRHLRDWLNRP